MKLFRRPRRKVAQAYFSLYCPTCGGKTPHQVTRYQHKTLNCCLTCGAMTQTDPEPHTVRREVAR